MENPNIYTDFDFFELGYKYLVNARYKDKIDLDGCTLIEMIDNFTIYETTFPGYFYIIDEDGEFYGRGKLL
jgi:hypothetical protein